MARNQTLANEAQIACALECFRIARGKYPETLDVLAPQFIKEVPHDIIGGHPLKYRRTEDGNILLYSVGSEVLSVVLLKLWANGQAEQVSVIGLMMMLLVIFFRWVQLKLIKERISTL